MCTSEVEQGSSLLPVQQESSLQLATVHVPNHSLKDLFHSLLCQSLTQSNFSLHTQLWNVSIVYALETTVLAIQLAWYREFPTSWSNSEISIDAIWPKTCRKYNQVGFDIASWCTMSVYVGSLTTLLYFKRYHSYHRTTKSRCFNLSGSKHLIWLAVYCLHTASDGVRLTSNCICSSWLTCSSSMLLVASGLTLGSGFSRPKRESLQGWSNKVEQFTRNVRLQLCSSVV